MVTEHRFASPQTNVTKQNKPGRTKRYDCIPLPTESATASNPADQVSWNNDRVCVFSPAGRDYPTGRVRLVIKDDTTTLLDKEVEYDFSTADMDAYVLPHGNSCFTNQ